MVESTLETWATARTFGFNDNTSSRESRSSRPSSVMPTYSSRAPRSWANICQGTMLEWCSISVRAITSPSFTLARPHDHATRLIASVALRVNTVSPGVEPANAAIRPRAPSNISVASAASA